LRESGGRKPVSPPPFHPLHIAVEDLLHRALVLLLRAAAGLEHLAEQLAIGIGGFFGFLRLGFGLGFGAAAGRRNAALHHVLEDASERIVHRVHRIVALCPAPCAPARAVIRGPAEHLLQRLPKGLSNGLGAGAPVRARAAASVSPFALLLHHLLDAADHVALRRAEPGMAFICPVDCL
jgi:hypothetical protein